MIVDRGSVVALDTPEALISSLGVDQRIVFSVPQGRDVTSLNRLSAVTRIDQGDERVIVYGHGNRFASSVVSALEDAGVSFADLRTQQPNLEDVFLTLTGTEMRE
jgi:ABC-2 type transport system ATP-binding protein